MLNEIVVIVFTVIFAVIIGSFVVDLIKRVYKKDDFKPSPSGWQGMANEIYQLELRCNTLENNVNTCVEYINNLTEKTEMLGKLVKQLYENRDGNNNNNEQILNENN